MATRIKKTDTPGFYKPCLCCGKGRVVATALEARGTDGWYITYRYQDDSETCGPYSRKEAVALVADHADGSSTPTLIGPNGYIFTVEDT